MLAKANRVVLADDFRAAVRRGRRSVTPAAVLYRLPHEGAPLRMGFIVSRAVGDAVQRNRVRRRMRAIGRQLVDEGASGADVVVRALPLSAELSWDELSAQLRGPLEDVVR